MKVKHELKPIHDKNSKILILGSLPSIKSRENKFYYANKTNRFWPIIESLFNVKLINNQDKEKFLIDNNIAMWDVISSCDIKNSSDSSIKNVKVNDVNSILNNSNIKTIFVTGKTALFYYNKYIKDKIKKEAIYLPSPSSANASYNLNTLINEYKIILKFI